jgi:hypothetical protein
VLMAVLVVAVLVAESYSGSSLVCTVLGNRIYLKKQLTVYTHTDTILTIGVGMESSRTGQRSEGDHRCDSKVTPRFFLLPF